MGVLANTRNPLICRVNLTSCAQPVSKSGYSYSRARKGPKDTRLETIQRAAMSENRTNAVFQQADLDRGLVQHGLQSGQLEYPSDPGGLTDLFSGVIPARTLSVQPTG